MSLSARTRLFNNTTLESDAIICRKDLIKIHDILVNKLYRPIECNYTLPVDDKELISYVGYVIGEVNRHIQDLDIVTLRNLLDLSRVKYNNVHNTSGTLSTLFNLWADEFLRDGTPLTLI